MLDSNFADRLSQAMKHRKVKASELVKKSELLYKNGKVNKPLTKPLISHYLKGTYEAKQDNVYTLSLILGVSEAWLMGYENSSMERNIRVDKKGNVVVSVPLVAEITNTNYLTEDNIEGTKEIDEALASEGDFFAYRVKDNSMALFLLEDDIIAVKIQDTIEDNEYAIVLVENTAYVRKVKHVEDGLKLIPVNRRINEETRRPLLRRYSCAERKI